jgi:3-dehydrosphinganine reductase
MDVDVLINNAGISMPRRFSEMPIDEFKRQMDINFLGSVYPTRSVIEAMKKRGSGRVVFVSSMAGQLGLYGFTAYSATKFAVRGMAEAL